MNQAPKDELYDRARQAIRDLKEQLAVAQLAAAQARSPEPVVRSRPEPVAIIGVGIRFPGAGTSLDRFWQMIRDGEDATTEIPSDRWDREAFYAPGDASGAATPGKMNTRRAAFIENVSHFDASFFDITPHEAARMDPQQRIFLETAWHAIEDAGLTMRQLAGSDTGVFVGVHTHSSDYQAMQFSGSSLPDAYAGSGTAHDMIGARLAYWLDLHGPSLTVNTACSSSLMAVHLACRSIRTGECEVAIAAGVNLLLKPVSTVAAAQLGMLAPDGRCKTFDARADGMGRGEGCGVVVLKSLATARRDGDRILATIRGSAVNQDGRTNGLTAPNGLAQQRVLRKAMDDAGVTPGEIGYLEAHGTGTHLGDPIEVEALWEVFGARVSPAVPCFLGAVKANIGHLEGAAGIAGLIKAFLVLRHGWIPPVANLQELNPHLRHYASELVFPQQGRSWDTSAKRLAGVSSFGWSGTNVHVILEEAAQPESHSVEAVFPLLITAASSKALDRLVAAYIVHLQQLDASQVGDLCFTSALRRTHHKHRVAVCGSGGEELASALRAQGEGTSGNPAAGQASELSRSMLRWEMGEEVDWKPFFIGHHAVLPGPLYRFEPVHHWIETAVEIPSAAAPSKWFYETDWVPAPLRKPGPDHSSQAVYILIHNGEADSDGFAAAARQHGQRLIELRRDSQYELCLSTFSGTVTNLSTDMDRIFAELARQARAPIHLLYLPGSGLAAREIADLLDLTQSLIRQALSIKLSLISFGEAAFDGGLPTSAEAAARGFSRVFSLEHPEFAGAFIQIDSASTESVATLFAELSSEAEESRVLLRSRDRYVARLKRTPALSGLPPLSLKADRSYLITGAFGRLGLHLVRWMIQSGARNLVLIGRRDPFASSSPSLIAEIEELRNLGANIIVRACDISNEDQVRKLFSGIADSRNALAGIIHAAANVSFGAILDAAPDDVSHLFSAKVEGARILDRLTRHEALDFFVLFSSAAATIGMRGAALYAAANSCLDEIVERRKAVGLPALCVEWGFWGAQEERDISYSEDKSKGQVQLIQRSGFSPMPPTSALAALGQLIVSGRGSALVADIDWTILAPLVEARGGGALIESLITGIETASGTGRPAATANVTDGIEGNPILEALRSLTSGERDAQLLELVTGEVRKVFGMTSDDSVDEGRGLFQLGMDSLMSVQLHNQLEQRTGLRLPETLTINYPSVRALAAYLGDRIAPKATVAEEPPKGTQSETLEVAAILQMSDADTATAIAAEVASISERLGRR